MKSITWETRVRVERMDAWTDEITLISENMTLRQVDNNRWLPRSEPEDDDYYIPRLQIARERLIDSPTRARFIAAVNYNILLTLIGDEK